MEIEKAIQVVKQVTEQFRGTLAEHQQIQQAVQIIEEEVKE